MIRSCLGMTIVSATQCNEEKNMYIIFVYVSCTLFVRSCVHSHFDTKLGW